MTKIIINNEDKIDQTSQKAKSKDESQKLANVYLWNKALERKPKNPNSPYSQTQMIHDEAETSISPSQLNIYDTEPKDSSNSKIAKKSTSQVKVSPFELISKKESPKKNYFPSSLEMDIDEKKGFKTKKQTNSIATTHDQKDNPQISQMPQQILETEISGFDFSQNDLSLTPMISTNSVNQIKNIILNLAEEISLISHEGKTETVITIKNSALFNDAKVTITEFKNAPKEMNITFENLSPKAHHVIVNPENQEFLKLALETKGIQVHIINAMTTLTTLDNISFNSSNHTHDEQKDQQSFDSSSKEKKDPRGNSR